MSFAVLATDHQVCLVKTETVTYDFASLAVGRKLRDKFFYHNSIKIRILFISASNESCNKFLVAFRGRNERVKVCESLENLTDEPNNPESSTSNCNEGEVARLKARIDQMEKDFKQHIRTLTGQVKKLLEITTCAQIDINYHVIDNTHVFVIPPLTDEDVIEPVNIEAADIDPFVCGNLNHTFRAAVRCYFSVDQLEAYQPTDKKEAAKLNHRVEYLKLFSIVIHNNWIKKYSASKMFDKRLISQYQLPGKLSDLTSVFHSIKCETRKGKGKKDKKNRTEIVAPTEEDSNDVVMDGETGDASLSDFASESESDNE